VTYRKIVKQKVVITIKHCGPDTHIVYLYPHYPKGECNQSKGRRRWLLLFKNFLVVVGLLTFYKIKKTIIPLDFLKKIILGQPDETIDN